MKAESQLERVTQLHEETKGLKDTLIEEQNLRHQVFKN